MNMTKALLFCLIIGCFISPSLMAGDGIQVGDQFPNFTLPSINDVNVTLSDSLGKGIVIIQFWKSQ